MTDKRSDPDIAIVNIGRADLLGESTRFVGFDFSGIVVTAWSTHICWDTESDESGEDRTTPAHFEEIFGFAHALTCDDEVDQHSRSVAVSELIYLITAAAPSLLQFMLGANLNREIGQFLKNGVEDDLN